MFQGQDRGDALSFHRKVAFRPAHAHETGKVLERENVGASVFLSLSTASWASCLLMSEEHGGRGVGGQTGACG